MKIEFHYTYILIALGFILTGYFPNLLVFTSIIIIHEIGHYTIAKINKLNVEKMKEKLSSIIGRTTSLIDD